MSIKLPPAWASHFRRRLADWFHQHGRALPWRETSDPYAIWISEIMLQQTQVATVIGYYQRFMHRFPDVGALAAAEEQEVLSLWAGLGYYRRARQLHAAAQLIRSKFEGEFPREFQQILTLPGIGRYTAGAIASFAYGTRAPILEANTVRLFSRLLALRGSPSSTDSQKKLWEFAESLLPLRGKNSGQLNQALMELGSLICVPKQPHCEACPVTKWCAAFQQGIQNDVPAVNSPKSPTPMAHGLVVIEREGLYLMRQNAKGGWWEGLWDFPRVDMTRTHLASAFDKLDVGSAHLRRIVEQAMQNELQLRCRVLKHLRTLKHSVTRFRISVFCYEAILHGGFEPTGECGGQWRWVELGTDSSVPLTATAQKLRNGMLAIEPSED